LPDPGEECLRPRNMLRGRLSVRFFEETLI